MPRWFPVRVQGESMAPTLRAGDLLAVRPLHEGEPWVGQIVVIAPGAREIVKRVASVDARGVFLVGDNAEASTDSRTLGSVQRNTIAGVVRLRYWPLHRARLL